MLDLRSPRRSARPGPSRSAARARAFGCVRLKGKTLDECGTIKNADIAKHLKLPPVKLHCSMLAEDAVKAAIKDYETKQAGTAPPAAATA